MSSSQVVGDRRYDVQLPVDGEEPTEEVVGELVALGRVDLAGGHLVGLRREDLEPLSGLVRRRLLDSAAEGFVVELLSFFEAKGEVLRERHLEERVPRAALVPEQRQETACPPVVLERFLVRIDGPCRVTRLEQVLDRLLRLLRFGEVPGEQPVDLLGRLAVDVLERLADVAV
ncbi:MAG: hypothetical protein E6G67_03900, partial [Actinobacteria bacterium]